MSDEKPKAGWARKTNLEAPPNSMGFSIEDDSTPVLFFTSPEARDRALRDWEAMAALRDGRADGVMTSHSDSEPWLYLPPFPQTGWRAHFNDPVDAILAALGKGDGG